MLVRWFMVNILPWNDRCSTLFVDEFHIILFTLTLTLRVPIDRMFCQEPALALCTKAPQCGRASVALEVRPLLQKDRPTSQFNVTIFQYSMTPDQLTVSSFTSEPDNLTELFNNTALPGLHDSRRTQGGFLVAGALLQGFIPTPINSNRPLTSWVWKQGEAISKKDEKGYVVNYWLCRECFESKLQHPQKHWLKAAAPTSTPQRHLIKYHNFDENGVKTAPRGQKRAHNDIRDLMDDQEQATKCYPNNDFKH